MIQELDRVVLTVDLPQHSLQIGDVGTVASVHFDNSVYKVEFVTLKGDVVAVVLLFAHQVRLVGRDEIAHVRQVPMALC